MSPKTEIRIVGEFDRVLRCVGQQGKQELFLIRLKDGRRIVLFESDKYFVMELGGKFQGQYFKEAEEDDSSFPLVTAVGKWDGMIPDGVAIGGPVDLALESLQRTIDETPLMTKAEIDASVVALRFDTGKNRMDRLDPRFLWMLGEIMTDNPGIRLDLVPRCAIEEMAKVYTEGAKKYTDNNWQKGMKWTKVIGPLMRHLMKWLRGEKLDPELGVHHLGQVMWNCAALIQYERTHPDLDDRDPSHMDMVEGMDR